VELFLHSAICLYEVYLNKHRDNFTFNGPSDTVTVLAPYPCEFLRRLSKAENKSNRLQLSNQPRRRSSVLLPLTPNNSLTNFCWTPQLRLDSREMFNCVGIWFQCNGVHAWHQPTCLGTLMKYVGKDLRAANWERLLIERSWSLWMNDWFVDYLTTLFEIQRRTAMVE
jgi:hypothetical protein